MNSKTKKLVKIMKICIITPLYDPWIIGGAEKYVVSISKELAKHHQIVVITTRGPKPRINGFKNQNPKVIEITPLNVDNMYSKFSNPSSSGITKKILWQFFDMWNLSTYLGVRRVLQKEKPDIVHTFGIKAFSPSIFTAIKNLRIPHVHTTNDFELISRWSALFRNGKPITQFNLLDRFYINYMRKISASIDTIIFPSKFSRDYHLKMEFFKNSKICVSYGMNLSRNFSPKEKYEREFLYVGQIVKHKGPDIAVKAFKKIKNKDVILHIVGKGPYLKKLKQLANNDHRIIFHGFIQNDTDWNQIYERCSYLIVPSVWQEIFGIVIIEAQNRGLPIIASNLGAIPELVKEGYDGFLFEPGNEESLHQIIENLDNDKLDYHQLSKNAIESSKRFFVNEHVKSILENYLELYM